jgi:hypothetical protein
MSWWATCYVIGAIVATGLATFVVTHPLLLRASDLKDPSGLAIQLRDEQNLLSKYLRGQFSSESRQLLSTYDGTGPVPETLLQAMVSELNSVLQGPWLYDKQRFAGIHLSDRTSKNIEKGPCWKRLIRRSSSRNGLVPFGFQLLCWCL